MTDAAIPQNDRELLLSLNGEIKRLGDAIGKFSETLRYIEDKKIGGFIIWIIGFSMMLLILIFLFAVVIQMKKWSKKRDEYYSQTHKILSDQISDVKKLVEKNVGEVLDSVKNVIKKTTGGEGK